MSRKYEPLETYLRETREPEIYLTFDKIAEIIGAELPASAFAHRAWWSNNPSNSVITYAWLNAGFRSTEVDMAERKLVFRKSGRGGSSSEENDVGPEQDNSGAAEAPAGGFFSRVFGALKGTVTTKRGTDLDDPAGTQWDAAR